MVYEEQDTETGIDLVHCLSLPFGFENAQSGVANKFSWSHAGLLNMTSRLGIE